MAVDSPSAFSRHFLWSVFSTLLCLFIFVEALNGQQTCPLGCSKEGTCATDQKATWPPPTLSVFSDNKPLSTITIDSKSLPTFGYGNGDIFTSIPSTRPSNKKRALPAVTDPFSYALSLYQRLPSNQWVPLDEEELTTTARFYNWNTSPGETGAGIKGLCGCTSVFVFSERGVYISHIWDESFEGCDADDAVQYVIEDLWNGNSMDNSPGLQRLIQDGLLSAQSNPIPLILAARDDIEGHGLIYPDIIRKLQQRLSQMIPTSQSPAIVEYTADLDNAHDRDTVNGRAAVEFSSRQNIVMYNGCPLPQSMWRLWVEGQEITSHPFMHPAIANSQC